MKVFRLACCRLGRILLVSALMLSVLVSSAVGETVVLHQHGARRAHLHVLGSGDLLSAAAWSSRFGHIPNPRFALQSAPQRVRILAIVKIGSVFLSTPPGAGMDETGLISSQNCPPFSIAGLQDLPAVDTSTYLCPAVGRTASAVLLQRNHALLI